MIAAWNRRADATSDAKDAARYRWLKARNCGPIGIVAWHRDEDQEMVLVDEHADASIDAAMADEKTSLMVTPIRPANTCPRCHKTTAGAYCCGVDLLADRMPWRMTSDKIRAVHILARSRKGLTDEEYRLRLQAMGLDSCRQMSREQFPTFISQLNTLSDSPRWLVKRRA